MSTDVRWFVYMASGEHLSNTSVGFNWAVAAYAYAALTSESFDHSFYIVKWQRGDDRETSRDVAAFVHGRLIWEDTGRI